MTSGTQADCVKGIHYLHDPVGNNAYVFPAVGLGVISCGAGRVTDEMFFAAARLLAGRVSEADLRRGSVYPPLKQIRKVSANIAAAVAEIIFDQDLAAIPRHISW